MKIIQCVLALIWLMELDVSAQSCTNANTNQISARYSGKSKIEDPIEKSRDFSKLLGHYLTQKGEEVFKNRFTYSELQWVTIMDQQKYQLHTTVADAGQKAFQNVGTYSLREAAVSASGVDDLFLRSSIGNTSEEELRPLSSSPNYSELQYFRTEKNSFGFRPWNSRPNLYTTLNFGHTDGRPAVSLYIKGSSFLDAPENTGIPRVDGLAIVPFNRHLAMAIGGSMYPTRMGSIDRPPSAGIRIEYSGEKPDTAVISLSSTISPNEGFIGLIVRKIW